ncbi:hypothetical protein [Nocardia sp. NPDC049149]|uniref:hypothetical protein n=1 Tax=Nocardia sp. NPDC049149 TaxID=3364315 RepID=UPI003723978D
MGYGSYTLADGREAGYLVDAVCDFAGCKTEVSRGLDQLCGQNPIGHKADGEPGCGNYYCDEHEVKHDCSNPACGKYAAEGRSWCGGLLAGHELPHRDAYTGEEFTQTEDDLANEDGLIVADVPKEP